MTSADLPLRTALPRGRGPISRSILSAYATGQRGDVFRTERVAAADPLGEDVQLALHLCYELHYQGLQDVDAEWEWDPDLLHIRGMLERLFLKKLRECVAGGDDVTAVLLVEPVGVVSRHLLDHGEWWQMREYFVHQSIYHHKETDPHAWVIPRLRGTVKAAMVAVQFDQFGAGHPDQARTRRYADLMTSARLSSGYLAYLDEVPACMLATVNMMSMFGLHGRFRGALIGHFAAAEATTASSALRLVQALQRWESSPECSLFFTTPQQPMRDTVIGDLLAREPGLAGDLVFGVQATELLERRFADHVLGCWRAGRTSLRSGRADPDRQGGVSVPAGKDYR
ncbi:iron-containing redox enzyme family protein [Amycolatopsis sp. NPDC059657]|uniref:iron-containing redox enzyme family protein n=1 Tax=Amycolatopsis sp. NPDC059657 TaxID=3346899 RepID=UPI0036701619